MPVKEVAAEPIPIPIDKGWMPDIAASKMPPGGLVQAKNLIPYDEAYKPARQAVALSSNTKSGTVLAGKEFKDSNDVYLTFLGTADKLWRFEASKVLTDITKAGAEYDTGENIWCFEEYGQWIIATNFTYAPQVLKGMGAANFQDLGGNPPKAKFCLLHKGHLIFAYLNEDGTISPKKLLWSAEENVELYTQSLVTGADSQVLNDAQGGITGLASRGNLIQVFHELSISLGWYSGGQYTFNFAAGKIKGIGGLAQGSFIHVPDGLYFWGFDDIYFWPDGGLPIPIGAGIRNTIFGSINHAFAYRMSGGHDAANGIVYWLYPTTSSTGDPDRLIVYNYRNKRFTWVDLSAELLIALHYGALTMDEIDTLFPSWDAVPYGMDSKYWLANYPIIAIVDPSTDKLATLTGAALTGVIETGDYRDGRKIIEVQGVNPTVDNPRGKVGVRVGSRMNRDESVAYKAAVVENHGYADVRSAGLYNRVELTTGEHDGIYDIEVDAVEVGAR